MPFDEFVDGAAHVLDVAEHEAVDRMLFERTIKPFCDSASLWLSNEREAWRDMPELERVEEVIGDVLSAVIQA